MVSGTGRFMLMDIDDWVEEKKDWSFNAEGGFWLSNRDFRIFGRNRFCPLWTDKEELSVWKHTKEVQLWGNVYLLVCREWPGVIFIFSYCCMVPFCFLLLVYWSFNVFWILFALFSCIICTYVLCVICWDVCHICVCMCCCMMLWCSLVYIYERAVWVLWYTCMHFGSDIYSSEMCVALGHVIDVCCVGMIVSICVWAFVCVNVSMRVFVLFMCFMCVCVCVWVLCVEINMFCACMCVQELTTE